MNNSCLPQYYVEGSHEAIIAPEEFQAVQEEIARRKELGRAYSDKAFHSKIICGDCGGFYGRKVWHSTKGLLFLYIIHLKNLCNSEIETGVYSINPSSLILASSLDKEVL